MYNELRAKYPVFNYNGFNIEEQDENMVITYDFEIVGLSEFNPTWTVKKAGADLKDPALRNMVFNLGMVELVSYWKITCSPQVNVKCGNLDKEQIQWWKKLYFNGLGECFFLNNIVDDVEHFMNISCDNTETFTSPSAVPHKGCMIPVGGGKDSSVSLSVLEDFRKDNRKDAEFSVKTSLVMEEISTKEKIEATKKDVEEKLEELAKLYNQKPEELKAQMTPELENSIRHEIVSEKLLKFLKANNTIK